MENKKTEKAQKKQRNFFLSFIFDGIILIALGIAILVWPESLLKILCIIAGAVIAVMGLIKLIIFIVNKDDKRKVLNLIVGIIQIAFGIVMIIESEFLAGLFFIIAGIILMYGSLLMFIRAFQFRKEKGALFVLSIIFAILTLALAIIIFINPQQFAGFIARLQGASLIIEGLGMIIVLNNSKIKVD